MENELTVFLHFWKQTDFIYIRIFYVIRRRSNELKIGKTILDLKEQIHGSFELHFNANEIYNHSFRHKKNCFSSHNSNQRHLFVTNAIQSNLFISHTSRTKHKNVEEYTVNQSHVQSTSTSLSSKLSEQLEQVYSETSRQYAQYIQMVPIPKFHIKTKSNPNDFCSFSTNNSIENTEIHTSQTTDTIDKIVEASMNDRQKDQQREDKDRINEL
ncbi:unnamed protein product [Schistosoma rodhaini]|nr:unnamed protein product [Schistosoma rodhaini]